MREKIMRVISFLLAALMVLHMVPITAIHAHAEEPEQYQSLEGKTLSILGASMSTYTGISNDASANATIGSNAVYYTEGRHGVYAEDTWWMQVCSDMGLRLLVNNSWSGSSLLHERSGTVGAYVDRCVQLHNNEGEDPDIIAIQMGTNDFQYYKDTLGTADIDYDALIAANGDGTYTYAAPATSLEAAAIVLHKISVRYPGAEVYYLNISQRVDGTDELIRSFNGELKQVVEHFGAHIVDIYGSAITMENFDTYIGDGRVHPNKLGMDAYTEAFKRAMIANTAYQVDTHTVSLELEGVTADYGDDKIVVDGDAFAVSLSADKGLEPVVTVTMGGADITASVYSGGTVAIDAVTADVTITAEIPAHIPQYYRWEFDGTELVCAEGGNALTKNAGTTTDGVFSNTRYGLETAVVLSHDQPWVVEWQCEGTFQNAGGSSGARIFTSTDVNAEYNARYIFKSNTNGLIAMGEKTSSGSHNYGIALGDHGIDWTQPHTYRLENRIAADGSNMIWLYVDDEAVGPMTGYYIGTKDQNVTSDWLSGKDFVFPYMGTDTHGFTNCSIAYIRVSESAHIHAYETAVTAPTCTEQGYTTYTCACGHSYVDTYVDALSHTYSNGICTACGATVSPYLQQLPENITGCTNLYDSLVPVKGYYTATKYDTSNGDVLSVVIPVEPGDRIAASSFGSVSENMGSVNGIRVTYLLGAEIVTSLSAGEVYSGYTSNGYIVVPDGVDAVCIPWWAPSDSNLLTLGQVSKDFAVHIPKTVSAQAPTCTESGYTAGEICEVCNISLGDREEIPPTGHSYSGDTCTVCGTVNLLAFLDGKYVSVLGDSISTFNGYSNNSAVNTTIGGNSPRYDEGTSDTKPGSYCLLESVNDTWWMHFANRSGMKLLVNNSWAGSQVFGGQTSDGRVIPAAYLDRCVNLHDNTLEDNPGNAPINPDVIFVYLGINDYNFNRSNVGTDAVDYAGLVNSDGTYVTPKTFGEAYGIMLHKMRNAYPDAQIFVMTLLPENLYSVDKTAWEQHNAYIRAAAEYYDIPVVDLAENCAITWENYSGYMIDKIHPTTAGMHLISDCIEAELVAYYEENSSHTHSYTAAVTAATCTEQGYTTHTCACGDSYVDSHTDALGHSYIDDVCTRCGATLQSLALRYDDHYDVTGREVEILDAGMPTSYQVGYGVAAGTPDEAVIILDGNTLVATGIGTAMVRIDGTLYRVEVTAAPISLLLLAGQSNMQGSEGNADQSIVCPDGMVYATYGDRYAMTVDNATNYAPSALTGAGSAVNVNGNTTNLAGWPVYLLNEAGAGKAGPDSGFAYEWVKQTGEKVWIVNAAHGGSSITTWQDGGANYEEAVLLFSACQETLRQEIAAGHYTLSHMGYFWCQGCTDYGQTAQWYVEKYLAMHENFRTELAFSEDVTFEFGGIIPVRAGHERYTSYRQGVYTDTTSALYHESFKDLRFTGPRVAQYWMINNPELSDIWGVCNIGENWVTMPDGTDGVVEYFRVHYENGTVDYTTQVPQKTAWYTPTTPAAVHDSIHYNQIGYNEVGREAARNALIQLGEIEAPAVETSVKFLTWDGYTEANEVTASTTGNSGTLVVPVVYPIWNSKEVTYEHSEGLSWNYYDLLAENAQTEGTLTVTGGEGSSVAVGKADPNLHFADHLSQLPEAVCCGLNLWNILEHDKYFYSGGTQWGIHSSGSVYSVTIPVAPGDRIFATSFGKAGENGHASANGIRVTFFSTYGVAKTLTAGETYAEFTANGGYLIAPEGTVAVNIPMWSNGDSNELYILSAEHTYRGGVCAICGAGILDSGYIHAVPENAGVQNAIDRARALTDVEWTPLKNIPGVLYVDGQYIYQEFVAGVTYTGIPYSGVIDTDTYVGLNVSLDSFLTALENEDSVLYTQNLFTESYPKKATYFGTVCSKFMQYVLDIPGSYNTANVPNIPGMSTIAMPGQYTADQIKLGDVIVDTGYHTAVCTGILYDADGNVAYVEISEAITPTCRRGWWSAEEFLLEFADYRLCRYAHIAEVPPASEGTANSGYALMPEYGDRYNYRVSSVRGTVNILERGYSKAVILRDGVIVDEIAVDDATEAISFDRSVPGYIEIYLEKADGTRSGSVYACVVESSVTVTDSSEFSSGKLTVRFDGSSGTPLYVQVGSAHAIFCSVEGQQGIAELCFRFSAVSTQQVRVAYQNEYGIYLSEWSSFTTVPNTSEDPLLSQGQYWDGYTLTPNSHTPVVQENKMGYWTYTMVPVKENTTYYAEGANRMWFLDADGNPISTYNAYKDSEVPFQFTTPEGTAYVSLSYSPELVEKGVETLREVVPAHTHSYTSVVTAPTCTEQGYTTHICACGDSYVDSYVEATGHSYGEWAKVTEATCTENGQERRDCVNCDHFETRIIEAKGHDYRSVVTAPTCTERGYTTHTCACGDSYVDTYVEAKGHSYGDWQTVTEATCTKDGQERRDCGNCDHFETRVIDAKGHSYTSVVTAPTCTEQGYTTHTCACGDSYVDAYVEAKGHSYGEWTVVTEATCTKDGQERRDCGNCNHYETRVIEAKGHSYTSVVTAPTCTEQGYTTHTCACGDSYVDTYVDAKGHSYGDWTVVTEATCTEDGQERRDCGNCDHYETRVIDAKGHDYNSVVTAPTCTEQGYTTHTCTCGDSYVDSYVEAKGHSYGEWTVVTEATCTGNGQERRDCGNCDHYETRVIDAKGHDYTSVVTAPTCTEQGYTTHTCACGDSYVDTYVEATGHDYVDGICRACGYSVILLGDVNSDGEIDILDANLVVTYYNEIRDLTANQLLAADVNGDGEVDIMDANMIVAYYNEKIDSFPGKAQPSILNSVQRLSAE